MAAYYEPRRSPRPAKRTRLADMRLRDWLPITVVGCLCFAVLFFNIHV